MIVCVCVCVCEMNAHLTLKCVSFACNSKYIVGRHHDAIATTIVYHSLRWGKWVHKYDEDSVATTAALHTLSLSLSQQSILLFFSVSLTHTHAHGGVIENMTERHHSNWRERTNKQVESWKLNVHPTTTATTDGALFHRNNKNKTRSIRS